MRVRFAPRVLLATIVATACTHAGDEEPTMLSVVAGLEEDGTVSFTFTITNTTPGETRFSGLGDGTLSVIDVRRDGTTIDALSSVARATEDLAFDVPASLRPLDPGDALEVELATDFDPAFSGQSLQLFALDTDADVRSHRYDLAEPGTYTMTFVYRYPDVLDPSADTFTEASNEATASFSIPPP